MIGAIGFAIGLLFASKILSSIVKLEGEELTFDYYKIVPNMISKRIWEPLYNFCLNFILCLIFLYCFSNSKNSIKKIDKANQEPFVSLDHKYCWVISLSSLKKRGLIPKSQGRRYWYGSVWVKIVFISIKVLKLKLRRRKYFPIQVLPLFYVNHPSEKVSILLIKRWQIKKRWNWRKYYLLDERVLYVIFYWVFYLFWHVNLFRFLALWIFFLHGLIVIILLTGRLLDVFRPLRRNINLILRRIYLVIWLFDKLHFYLFWETTLIGLLRLIPLFILLRLFAELFLLIKLLGRPHGWDFSVIMVFELWLGYFLPLDGGKLFLQV